MRPERRGDEDGLDVVTREQVLPVLVQGGARPSELDECVCCLVPVPWIDVADGAQVDERPLALSEQHLALPAGADEPGTDRPSAERTPQGRRRAERGQRRDAGQRLQEIAAPARPFLRSQRHLKLLPYVSRNFSSV